MAKVADFQSQRLTFLQVQLQTRLAKFLQYLLQMLEMVIKGQGEDQQVIEVDQEKVEQEA